MSDRAAILAAIRANPDDDTPRLVFADWLDEHEPDANPPESKGRVASPSSWAALIRAECEFARLQADGSAASAVYDFFAEFDDQTFKGVRWERVLPDMRRRIELAATAKRVRPKARSQLSALIPRNAGVRWRFDTHRGFPNSLYLKRQTKVDVSQFDRLPAFALLFEYIAWESPQLVRELVEDGLLRNVRALTMREDRADLMPPLSASTDVSDVREFTVQRGAGSVSIIVRWLTESARWSGLRDLRLESNEGLGGPDAVRAFAAEHLHRLSRLHIRGDGLWSARTVRGLAAFTELRDLRLIGCGLDDAAAERLADMPGLANLRTLNLTDNRISGVGASALIASPHLKNLTVLDFDENWVRGLDRTTLANAPAGGLRALGMQDCRMTARDITAIATSPRVSELLYFSLCESIAEPAIARLVKGFGDRAPAVLYLKGTEIGAAGAEALANWPAAAQIDMLHLERNPITTTAAKTLASCPHLKQLTHLCADVTHPAAKKVLRKCFGKHALV